MACDQPLYVLAKIIQWNFPDLSGESKFGDLHIEMAALKALGSFLAGSGWVGAITESGLNTSGTAESFLTAADMSRCRHAHEVTAASLHILQHRAFLSYRTSCSDPAEVTDFHTWCSR
jgi:hypothetical protein